MGAGIGVVWHEDRAGFVHSNMSDYLLLQADARRLPVRDGSVHCVVTSPPYWGLRDYGVGGQLGLERTPDEFVAAMVAVFREVRRVLHPTGTVFMNLGDSYAGSTTNGEPRSGEYVGDGGKAHPNVRNRNGLGAVSGLKPKDLIGIPWRTALALQADGWYLRSDIIWAKPNPMPESVTDRPTKSHEYVFLLAKSERYFFDGEAVREEALNTGGNGSWGERGDGKRNPATRTDLPVMEAGKSYWTGRNIRTVWSIPTEAYPGSHFATFPRKLVEPCIKAGCPEGGIVFDPFVGSGTTIVVANALGRRGIGTDLSREYLGLARHRITKPHARVPRPNRAEHHPLFERTES